MVVVVVVVVFVVGVFVVVVDVVRLCPCGFAVGELG